MEKRTFLNMKMMMTSMIVTPRLICAALSALDVSSLNYSVVYCAPKRILNSIGSCAKGLPVSASMNISGMLIVMTSVSGSSKCCVMDVVSPKITCTVKDMFVTSVITTYAIDLSSSVSMSSIFIEIASSRSTY